MTHCRCDWPLRWHTGGQPCPTPEQELARQTPEERDFERQYDAKGGNLRGGFTEK